MLTLLYGPSELTNLRKVSRLSPQQVTAGKNGFPAARLVLIVMEDLHNVLGRGT